MNIHHTFIVAKYTFYEIYKTKIFFSTIFVGLIIFLFTILATKLSYGAPQKVALDISLGLISLSAKAIAFIYSVNILTKEIEARTLHIILSRSVSRSSFLLGKIIGPLLILIVNIASISLIGILSFLFFEGQLTFSILLCLFAILLESALILCIGIFFSLFVNKVLNVLIVLSMLFSSYFIPEILGTIYIQERPLLKSFLKIVDYSLPQFARLNIKDIVLYEAIVQPYPLVISFTHSMFYLLLLVLLAIKIFRRKDLE